MRPNRFAITVATAAIFAGGAFALMAFGLDRAGVYWAESFGDRRLDAPRADECQIARLLLRDLRDHRLPALTAAAGLRLGDVGLRAIAWRSSGTFTPGQGADWRKCPGLGRYERGLGLTPMGSGDLWASVYISRARFSGDEASVWETFSPRAAAITHGPDPPEATAVWKLTLRRDGAGAWRLEP